jgi:hypothetical protein
MNGKMKGSGGLVAALLVVTAIAAMVPMTAGIPDEDYCMSGYKLDTNNNPIEGWTIYVWYPDDFSELGIQPEEIIDTTTDSNGYWRLCVDGSANEYTVFEEVREGWNQVGPETGNYIVGILDLADGEKTNLNFTNVPVTNPGTGTPGYWKNHPWPEYINTITMGGVTYTKEEAIANMSTPDGGDKTYTMFRDLVCAKLNVWVGNNASCISDTIIAADAWMATYGPAGSGVAPDSAAWLEGGLDLYEDLNDYNSGRLPCAPHIGSGTTTGTSSAGTAAESTIKEPGNGNKKLPKK